MNPSAIRPALGSTLLALLGVFLCSPTLASANSDVGTVFRGDGHDLLAECGEIVTFLETGVASNLQVGGSYCLGMVNGMLNLNTIYQAQQERQPLFCPPRDRTVTNAEAARTVVHYLRENPQRLDQDQASLMFFAFEQAWPCP